MKQGYVIGGHWAHVVVRHVNLFAQHGIDIDQSHHLDGNSMFRGHIPKDAEVVIVFQDMIKTGLSAARAARDECRRLGLPCITTTRESGSIRTALNVSGFAPTCVAQDTRTPERLAAAAAIELLPEPKRDRPKAAAQDCTMATKGTQTAPSTSDIDSMGFDALQQHMVRVLRVARERHRVTGALWTRDGGLSLTRERLVEETTTVEV